MIAIILDKSKSSDFLGQKGLLRPSTIVWMQEKALVPIRGWEHPLKNRDCESNGPFHWYEDSQNTKCEFSHIFQMVFSKNMSLTFPILQSRLKVLLFEWLLGIASKITPKAPVEGSRRIRSNRNCSLLVPFAAQVIHNALANALISDNVDLDWWLPWWQQGKGRWGWRRQAGDVILLTTEPSDLFTTVRSHGSLGSHALLNDSYLCTWRDVLLSLAFRTIADHIQQICHCHWFRIFYIIKMSSDICLSLVWTLFASTF